MHEVECMKSDRIQSNPAHVTNLNDRLNIPMKTRLLKALLACGLVCFNTASHANLQIKFVESAPKDWFALTNLTNCDLSNVRMNIDLSNSAGKLIFDTTASGAGVEVFQPFEVRSGEIALASGDQVADGDRTLAVLISRLKSGETASFTIDVDDTMTNSELGMIRVSDSEITGSEVSVSVDGGQAINGALNKRGELLLDKADCAQGASD